MSNLELKQLPSSIPESIEKELTIENNYNLIEVINEPDLAKAEIEIKSAKQDLKNLTEKIKPIKKAIDNFKGLFLDKEKIESVKVNEYILSQEKYIKTYKAKILEEQRKAREQAEREAKAEAERLAAIEREKLEADKLKKEQELKSVQSSDADLSDRFNKTEELRNQIDNLDKTVIPEIEIAAKKVVLKKDEIKTKNVYFVSNESDFIDYALQFNKGLLEIKISKSTFNEWIKKEENQKHSFVDFKEEII